MTRLLALFIIIFSFSAFAVDKPALGGGDNSKEPIKVDADTLEVFQEQQKAVFSGNVFARQGTMNVKADRMIIYYLNKADNGGQARKTTGSDDVSGAKNSIKKIDLEGNVFLTAPNQTAKSEKGYYDMQKNFISMTGNVILTKDNNILKGNKLDYNTDTGYSKLYSQEGTKGRVSGLFVPAATDGK